MEYPSFLDFLRERVGPKWVVARRLTDGLRAKGHEVAISERRYADLEDEWAAQHPATLMAATLPAGEVGDAIRACVRQSVRSL